MDAVLARQKQTSRRILGMAASLRRLHAIVQAALPDRIARCFDPSIESATLSATGMILFMRRCWRGVPTKQKRRMRDWLLASAEPAQRELLDWGLTLSEQTGLWQPIESLETWSRNTSSDVYEEVVARLDARSRKRHGLYCTPWELTRFVVRRTDQTLREQFGLANGLSSSRIGSRSSADRRMNILEPAVGTGIFLQALLRHSREQFDSRSDERCASWSDWVANDFLPRLFACDVQLGPLACTSVRLAAELLHCGFDFSQSIPLRLHRLDLLQTVPNPPDAKDVVGRSDAQRSTAELLFAETEFAVIIGNPPYGAHHGRATASARALLRGQLDGPGGDVNYFQTDEGPLTERKTWLYDLYIQFLRFAHWRIERAGNGVAALLTNRGFLDNGTMRGMRYQWLRTLDRIEIHDFQGGRHRTSDEIADVENNVFGIRSGIALSILCAGTHAAGSTGQNKSVWLHEHRGGRAAKLRQLDPAISEPLAARFLVPRGPLFVFQPGVRIKTSAAAHSIPLDRCFTTKASAVVTARDGLVTGFEPNEVLDQIGALRDQRRSDDELRELLFARSRGQKYARGDTRGWKLAEARRKLRAQLDWESNVRRCSYRPLDDRWIYWHPDMIDWPRTSISQLMLSGKNPALVARRQLPNDPNANFFWITRFPTIDGIVRSDNRGNEFVFPLFADEDCSTWNLSAEWIEIAERRLGRSLNSRPGRLDTKPDFVSAGKQLSHRDLVEAMIATLFSASYRSMHQDVTRHEFIPMSVPSDKALFRKLAEHGGKLLKLLTGDMVEQSLKPNETEAEPVGIVEPPRFDGDQIWSGDTVLASGIEADDWTFRAGCHQICRKWLLDRRGRPLTESLRAAYAKVCRKVQSIRAECRSIEETIRESGGWRRLLS